MRYDNLLFTIAKKIVNRYTKITGRSNFSAARMMLGVFFALYTIGAALSYRADPTMILLHPAPYIVVASVLFCIYWYEFAKMENKLRDFIEHGGETMSTELLVYLTIEWKGHRFLWRAFTMMGLVFGMLSIARTGTMLLQAGWVVLGLSFPVAWTFDLGGGKSVVARTKEKVKATLHQLQPAPVKPDTTS